MRQIQITQSITNRATQSIESYLSEIAKVELITAQEEVILAQRIREGDQSALERLTKTNLRFVVSVAKKYQHMGMPLGDLISEGNLGLIQAAKKFDETKGFKFISYAVWWIRQSILAALTEHSRMIRLPMNKIKEINSINNAMNHLEQQVQGTPTIAQTAEYLDIPPEKVTETLAVSLRTSSYDSPIQADSQFCLLDALADPGLATDHALMTEERNKGLASWLDQLTERDRRVIEWSFGLTGEKEKSNKEISKYVGVSAEAIRQIRLKALEKLRSYSAAASQMPVCEIEPSANPFERPFPLFKY